MTRTASLSTRVAAAITMVFALLAAGTPASAVEVGGGPGSVSGVVSSQGLPLAGLSIQIYPLVFSYAAIELVEYAIN